MSVAVLVIAVLLGLPVIGLAADLPIEAMSHKRTNGNPVDHAHGSQLTTGWACLFGSPDYNSNCD